MIKQIDVLSLRAVENQSFKIFVPIFDYDIEVVFGKEALSKMIKKFPKNDIIKRVNNEYTDELCNGVMYPSAGTIFLYINKGFKYLEFMNTLSHEIKHAVDLICSSRGIDYIPGSNNETFTYLTGYITEKIIEKTKLVIDC